jgi:hypothetical protein
MMLATTLVSWTSYTTAQAARLVRLVPAIMAPVAHVSACGLSTFSLLLEALNTLAVSQYHQNARTAGVEALWALVASSLARIAAWDSNVLLARTSQHDTHTAFSAHFRECMLQCRQWILASDESALVEAEWHVATMLAFVRRSADLSSRYTAHALCVLLTLLQYHQAQVSAAALELFFKTATTKAAPDEYCVHTAVWIASHVNVAAACDAMCVEEEELNRRADEAHAALLELHI